MDLLDVLLGHDRWTSAKLLEIGAALGEGAMDHQLDIGHRSLRATFDHVIWNIEAWTDGLRARPLRPRPGGPDRSCARLAERLEEAYADFADRARELLELDAWEETWIAPGQSPPVERTYGATIAHVITHGMHHRAQILFMLGRLGATDLPEGDVLSWARLARDTG